MNELLPSIDYSCARCGNSQSYRLVPADGQAHSRPASISPAEIPSIDLRCSRCGTSQTYQLVPVAVTSDAE
jgi:hypothetical protein